VTVVVGVFAGVAAYSVVIVRARARNRPAPPAPRPVPGVHPHVTTVRPPYDWSRE
jgi:hypothetical protein